MYTRIPFTSVEHLPQHNQVKCVPAHIILQCGPYRVCSSRILSHTVRVHRTIIILHACIAPVYRAVHVTFSRYKRLTPKKKKNAKINTPLHPVGWGENARGKTRIKHNFELCFYSVSYVVRRRAVAYSSHVKGYASYVLRRTAFRACIYHQVYLGLD